MSDVTIFDDRSRGDAVLTCIIPFRYLDERPENVERFKHPLLDTERPSAVVFLVVDDGSPIYSVERTRRICEENGYSYVYLNTSLRQFSVGRCRNVGTQHSRSAYVFMQDIDLMPYKGFYRDLLNEISVQGLHGCVNRFIMVPYVFLSERGTTEYLAADEDTRKQEFLHRALVSDIRYVDKYSSGTSANLYNRIWYLSCGGNDPEFEGWGYEDIEFNTRAIRHSRYFPISRDWSVEKYNFNSVVEWRTYKAAYRLHGDLCLFKGIVLFHAWHPVIQSSEYMQKQTANRDLFIKKLKSFPSTGSQPPALQSEVHDTWICFRENAFTTPRLARSALGKVVRLDENSITSKGELHEMLERHQARGYLMFNPYQTEHMLRLYGWMREDEITYIVAERGALPGSCFFDPSGFLADSESYSKDAWSEPLTVEDIEFADAKLAELSSATTQLEAQSPSIGVQALRTRLRIPEKNIVVFVGLQRPGDTVTRFFIEGPTYQEFLEQIRVFGRTAPQNISLVIKKHPLEDEILDVDKAIVADNENIDDLIGLADLIWTFNSGVGIMAMMANKPVAYSGKCFYAVESVNWKCHTAGDVLNIVQSHPVVDRSKALQFLRHLVSRVYSFGEQVTKPVRMPDGSRMTATMDIRFETLRLPSIVLNAPSQKKAVVGWDSLLFDRYRFAERQILNEEKSTSASRRSEQPYTAPSDPSFSPLPNAFPDEIKRDLLIRNSWLFTAYYWLYSHFLSTSKAEQLYNRPSHFLMNAKHPATRVGRVLFSGVIRKKQL
ncbi:capsular polysaccharide export protein, LipB/KpsS family [Aureimonas frigidaquae]|uniref:capsular polysaccharide export protein, LipB/KpsS family n=1 Tax=Aureimonas frigidaquae TaxID=424757 RepID=UPI0009F8A3F5|nr:hypothetical protein [Aureimonas frigidaquae]